MNPTSGVTNCPGCGGLMSDYYTLCGPCREKRARQSQVLDVLGYGAEIAPRRPTLYPQEAR